MTWGVSGCDYKVRTVWAALMPLSSETEVSHRIKAGEGVP